LCSSRKYPYTVPPQWKGVFLTPPHLWKFQLSFIHSFKFFGLIEPPLPQEIPIPSTEGVWRFSGTALYVKLE